MLIPLFFLWEWASLDASLNPHNSLYFNRLQVFLNFRDMLIGSVFCRDAYELSRLQLLATLTFRQKDKNWRWRLQRARWQRQKPAQLRCFAIRRGLCRCPALSHRTLWIHSLRERINFFRNWPIAGCILQVISFERTSIKTLFAANIVFPIE